MKLIGKIEKSMIEVINAPNGTANNIKDTRYVIAGKTGTAQIKSYEDQEYEDIRKIHSSEIMLIRWLYSYP